MARTYLAISHQGGYKGKIISEETLLSAGELDSIKVISWNESDTADMINNIYSFLTRNAILSEETLVKELKAYNVLYCGTAPTVMEIKSKITSDYKENLKFMFYLKEYLNISDSDFNKLRKSVAQCTGRQFDFLNRISFKQVINKNIRRRYKRKY